MNTSCPNGTRAHLKAKTRAATETRMMDTAPNAGPRFAFDGFTGSWPHVVPGVPAPKFATAGDKVDVEEGEAEPGETTVAGRADEVPEEV